MITKNHDSPGKGKAQHFLLTTKLFCGLCGEAMVGDGGTGKSGQAYAYYSCNSRKKTRNCRKESVKKDWIEQLVVDQLVALIHSDEFINEVADKVMVYQQREQDRSALTALEIRHKDNEKALGNMMAAIEAGIITPSTKSRLMELEGERANIEKGIARELIAEPQIERDQVIFFLEGFRTGDIDDESYRILLVDTLLNSVYLYDDDKLVLVLNYSGEHCKVTLSLVEKALDGEGAMCSTFAPSGAPNDCKPNLFPIGDGFGFVIYLGE